MTLRSFFRLPAVLLGLGLLPLAAHADTLNIGNVNVTSAGGTVAVYGTYTNTTGAYEYFNGDDFNMGNPGITLGTDFFFNNGPYGLGAGQSFTEELFTLAVNSGLAAGTYSNYFDVVGGADQNTYNTLSSTNFNLVVSNAAVSATPEPAAWVLLLTGMLGLGTALLRRREAMPSPAA